MFSYLLQLGWSSSNEDNYEYSKAVELFTLEKINKSPSKFDIKKLNNINSKFLNNMDVNEVYDLVCKSFNLNLENIQKNRLVAFLPELLKRVNVYTEIRDDIEWIVNESFICIDSDNQKILNANLTLLKEISLLLNSCSWTKDNINSTLKNYIINKNLKFKEIGYPLRLALTGKINSPDLASVIYELGCTIVTNRLNYQY
jgi:glutamyl-tRNA synthetase